MLISHENTYNILDAYFIMDSDQYIKRVVDSYDIVLFNTKSRMARVGAACRVQNTHRMSWFWRLENVLVNSLI